MRMIEGGDIAMVSRILEQASIQMTLPYCRPTPENMQCAVDKLGESFRNVVVTGKNLDMRSENRAFKIPVSSLFVHNYGNMNYLTGSQEVASSILVSSTIKSPHINP
jgi:hypothetical protein